MYGNHTFVYGNHTFVYGFFRTLFPQLFAKLFKIDHKIFQFISKSFFQFQSFFQKTELATVQGSAATFLDAMRYLLVQVLATQAFCKVIHLKASHTDMELSGQYQPNVAGPWLTDFLALALLLSLPSQLELCSGPLVGRWGCPENHTHNPGKSTWQPMPLLVSSMG